MKPGNGVKTISMRVDSEGFELGKAFACQALGGEEVYTEPGLAVFRLPHGELIELYGPGSNYPDYLFEKNSLVLGFRVSNLEEAILQATRAGMELISGIQKLGSCFSYCYLRDKKGTIFGLTNS